MHQVFFAWSTQKSVPAEMAILNAPQKLYTQNQPHPNQPPRSVLNILSHYSRTIQRSAYFVWYSSSPSMRRGKRNIDAKKIDAREIRGSFHAESASARSPASAPTKPHRSTYVASAYVAHPSSIPVLISIVGSTSPGGSLRRWPRLPRRGTSNAKSAGAGRAGRDLED